MSIFTLPCLGKLDLRQFELKTVMLVTSAKGNHHPNFGFLCFFVFELHMGQTDRRARPIMQPTRMTA